MKNRTLKRNLAAVLLLLVCFGCGKMDDPYKEFIVPGGLVYPGSANGAKAFPGRYRIELVWKNNSERSANKARVFWNSGADSLELDIPADADTLRSMIGDLQERAYTFQIRTYDGLGNVSIPVEVLGKAYGDKYQQGLLARPVVSSEILLKDTLTIAWAAADTLNGAFGTEVQYQDLNGQEHTAYFKADEDVSKIAGVKPGVYKFRTVYVPDSVSVDTFYTDFLTERILRKVDKSNWTASTDSYAETSQLPLGGPPAFAIDDDVNTFWHTDHTTTKPPYPHWLAVDMKTVYKVAKVQLTCRPNVTNSFTQFTIQGSMDGEHWTDYDSYPFLQQNPPQDFAVTGEPEMRYIRILATAGPNYYANLAEFSVFAF